MATPERGRCAFFVQKKKRFCKMVAGKGKKYCGEHATMGQLLSVTFLFRSFIHK